MEPPSGNIKMKTIFHEKSVSDIQTKECASKFETKNMIESELQKSILKKSNNGSNGPNLFKIIPKTIPLKTIQGPNGNLFVQGPQKKILSLHIKSSSTTTNNSGNAFSTPSVSFLPITFPKDTKVPSLTLITSAAKNSTKDVPSKNITPLETKSVSNTVKRLISSPTSTVPITITKIAKNLSLPFSSKTFTSKSDNTEIHSVTIEKRNISSQNNIKQLMKLSQITDNNEQNLNNRISSASNMINIQSVIEKKTETNGLVKTLKNNDVEDAKVTDTTTSTKSDSDSEVEIVYKSSIKVKNIDTLVSPNTYLKSKQQSLLRNKTIDKLKRSPRTKGRSKSLTAITKKVYTNKKRRSSTASDIVSKKLKSFSNLSLDSIKSSSLSNENEDSALLCLEKMETTPPGQKSKSTQDPLALDTLIICDDKDKILDDTLTEKNVNITIDYRKLNEHFKTEVDYLKILDWSNGIGMLKNSNLYFQYNEFGLIETVDSNESKSIDAYTKPIYERDSKSHITSDYSDPLYYCKVCNCRGAAVDFLMPDFCSHECIQKYNQRIGKPTKKYINRKKLLNKLDQQTSADTNSNDIKQNDVKNFDWDTYLSISNTKKAPTDLFLNPFPSGSNPFKVGMKVEAIDPDHSSIFAVCTIVQKMGYRLKLHFDGYSSAYDFWINADSMDIFPPGWCAKTNRVLQPPKGIIPSEFNWPSYCPQTKSSPAPRDLFVHLNSSSNSNPFKVGMKLEADDLRNTGKVCVASIADILDNRILIHFDGWADTYDYWINITSPYIHPVDWHKKNGFSIVSPPEYKGNFSWSFYLSLTKCIPATEDMFLTRNPINFGAGMKLEVVDKRNPPLIRPATIIMTDEYEIKVLFDGWSIDYAFWIEDDSPDIHPVGWCELTGHELEPPPGYNNLPIRAQCMISGCRGIGNIKCKDIDFHTSLSACPYEINNWSMETEKSDRLSEYKAFLENVKQKEIVPKMKRKATNQDSKIGIVPKRKYLNDYEDNSLDTRINISRSLLCDYGPRLLQVHSLWKKNSECLMKNFTEDIQKNPLEWSVEEVAEFVEKIPQCQIIAQDFRQEEIDGSAFLSLRQTDLTDIMKMKLGPAIKIYNQIVQLREEAVVRFFRV